MKKTFISTILLVVLISFIFILPGCKTGAVTETTTAETTVAETTVTETTAAATTAATGEEFVLGKENSTYWVEQAGLTPKGELKIYSYKDEGVAEWKIAKKFEEAYPDVTIKWITIPGADYTNKILLECQTNTLGADIFWSYAQITAAMHNYLLDITDKIPEALKNDVSPGSIGATGYAGKWYGAALFMGMDNGVEYNIDILKNAGYDKPPATWDEFFKACEAATIDENNDGIPEVFGYTGIAGPGAKFALLDTIIESVGGKFWNEDPNDPKPLFNDDKGVRLLQIMKKMYKSDFSDPGMASGDDMASRKVLASGKAAMGIQGTGAVWGLAKTDFPENANKIGEALMPSDPGYPSPGQEGSCGFVIGQNANVDAALGFILFYMSPEMQKFETKEYAFSSARISLGNDAEYIKEFPYIPVMIEQAKVAAHRYVEPNAQALIDSMVPILDNYLNGNIDEKTCLTQMEEAFNDVWAAEEQ